MTEDVPRPLAFVAMPFRTRATGLRPPEAPVEVDFDALWDRAISPALSALGFIPIRADNQGGAVIIKDMLEQLLYADLVIADISIDNANVYYEAGIRHGTRREGCVLIGASWARPVFDLEQIRQIRYPLPGEKLGDEDYARIREVLAAGISQMANALSPVYELTDYPDATPSSSASSFRAAALSLSQFQQALRSARLATRAEACRQADGIVAAFFAQPRQQAVVAKELLDLVRDCQGWTEVIAFIEALPPEIRGDGYFAEQLGLARSKAGDPTEAIAALEQLIADSGETAERRGLLGGRYKRLYAIETDTRRKARLLNKAIEQYTRGMQLDLNDYYCACNLPRLLRARGRDGDAQRAAAVGQLVVLACERARARDARDPWLNPTLLGAAFDAGDTHKARQLRDEIEDGDHRQWQLESTLPDLQLSAALIEDQRVREELEQIIDALTELVWVSRTELRRCLSPLLGEADTFRKTLRIRARPARAGENVATITADGLETRNQAKGGEFVVENQGRSRERYLVPAQDFARKYRKTESADGDWSHYEPGDDARIRAIRVDEAVLAALGKGASFYIEAPWNTPQRVARGDYLVAPLDGSEVYRIGAVEFAESYAPA